MKGRAITLLIGGVAVVGAAAATALTLSPAKATSDSDSSPAMIAVASDSSSVESSIDTSEIANQAVRVSSASPRIPSKFAQHAEFIRRVWADGPNLSDSYVQIAVPCGRDCFALIIGDTRNGEIYDSGMGYSEMPELGTDSRADSDLILLTWLNIPGGNCMRAIYRWDGQSLGGVSDVLEYPYTDAGCGQFQLQHVMSDLD